MPPIAKWSLLALAVVLGAAGAIVLPLVSPPPELSAPGRERAAPSRDEARRPAEPAPDPDQVLAMTYDELMPAMEGLLVSKPVTDTPSGYRAFLCVDVRTLRDPREKVAYLALTAFSQRQHGVLLQPYVVSSSMPEGLWGQQEIREVMAPIVEEAKREYIELLEHASE